MPSCRAITNAAAVASPGFHQSRRGAGRADDADGAGRVPAFLIMSDIDPRPDDLHCLEPNNVRIEHGLAAGIPLFGQRQQRRRQNGGGMAAIAMIIVVKVERMCGSAIH